MKVTYLGPAGATFSAFAYEELAMAFNGPSPQRHPETEEVLAGTNEEVMPLMLQHRGYGAIAMETRAEGRVDGPLNSFITLLGAHNVWCPTQVLGAMSIRLHFALLAKHGVRINDVKTVVAHPKALGACKRNLQALGVRLVESASNGKAAEDIAASQLAHAAAIAPRIAARKYGLSVLNEALEDEPAATTFFFLGPREKQLPRLGLANRALMVFRVKHVPGALVRALQPFADEGISLFHIHSLYTGEGEYDFAIETECREDQAESHARAVARARKEVARHLLFGPFPVVTA